MTATHGDVVDAAKIIKPCKVLDLGCGQGRNSLYLSLKGYDVTSWDHNENSIAFLNETKDKENLNIKRLCMILTRLIFKKTTTLLYRP